MFLQEGNERRKKEKDPSKPIRVRGAYIQFTTEQIPKLKAQPVYAARLAAKELKHTDFMGLAAAEWGKLTPTQKIEYEKLEEADRIRHTR